MHKRKINLEFKYPYVNDSLEWKNIDDKSAGYTLNDGLTDLTIDADLVKSAGKKTQLKIVSKDRNAKKI